MPWAGVASCRIATLASLGLPTTATVALPRACLVASGCYLPNITCQLQALPGHRTTTTQGTCSRRSYATQTSLGTTTGRPKQRKAINVFNDDGQVPWGQLSPAEKAARTAQQSFNFTLIIGGAVLTIAVFTFMYTDVFSSQSGTVHFNRAVDRIRTDPAITKLLGDGKEIRAFGEPSWNKWRRNRPLAFRTETDKFGTERLYMHFNLAGPKGTGVAQLYMLRRQDEKKFNYGFLAVDIPGQSRIYVERADADTAKKSTPGTFLGIKWS